MILIDLNQVMISNLMMQLGSSKTKIEEGLVRHMVLNTIRLHVKMFRDFGKVVIACDNKKYWRRDYFANYKAGRKKLREKSEHDWHSIFECLNKIREELKSFSPYIVLDVDGAEADDVIGVLALEHSKNEKVMILSSDKDFIQLQNQGNIFQYSPILKKKIVCEDPVKYLKEMIIKGDASDGIPNILSDDNVFVDERRQTPITKKKMDKWMQQNPLEYGEGNAAILANYFRNRELIDLACIPESIKNLIIEKFNEFKPSTKQNFMNYMIKNKLTNLMEVFEDF